MGNIFGKSEQDYKFIKDARDSGYNSVNGVNLEEVGKTVNILDQNAYNGMDFLRANSSSFNAEAYNVLYSQEQLSNTIPEIKVPEGANSFTYSVSGFSGKSTRITNSGKDVPVSDATFGSVTGEVFIGGNDVVYSTYQLREANFQGVALDTNKISAAMYNAQKHLLNVGMLGEENRKPGLLNNYIGNSAVTNNDDAFEYNSSGIDLTTSSADQVYKKLNSIISSIAKTGGDIINQVNNLTLIGSNDFITDLLSMKFDSTDTTVGEQLKTKNAYTSRTGKSLIIKGTSLASGVNAVVDSNLPDIAAFYFNDLQVLGMALPQKPQLNGWFQSDVATYKNRVDYRYSDPFMFQPKLNMAFGTKS